MREAKTFVVAGMVMLAAALGTTTCTRNAVCGAAIGAGLGRELARER